MRKTVLIYPGNSYSSLQIYECLKNSLRYKPIMGNHGRTHCEFVCDECYFDLPLVSDENFLERINLFIEEHNVQFVIPAHDTVAEYLQSISSELKAVVVCSEYETAQICRHKSMTYSKLEGNDFLPYVYGVDDELTFPIFMKDDIGQGGKNSFLVRDRQELEKKISENKNIQFVLCEYLPGKEITVDCFTNYHGQLLFCQPRPREQIMNGISGYTYNIELSDEIRNIAAVIMSRIKFRGYWFFQCKQDSSGKYKLMEVSTRFAGTFCLSKNLDVNLPLLALTDFEGIDVEILPNSYGICTDRFYMNRYKLDYEYQRVYIDFDDTIVFGRKYYNTQVMAFIFQCLNEGKELILITRHAYNIFETMEKLHLDSGIFRKVVEVEDGKCKADYMEKDVSSIFIDNSFAERVDVKRKLGIPTFDVCNIECLLKG